MNDSKLIKSAVRNVVGVIIYVSLVVTFLNNAEGIFGPKDNPPFAGIAMLMLFVLSALVTGLLVLGQPVWLFLSGQKKESLKMLGYTVGAMFAGTVLVFVALALISR